MSDKLIFGEAVENKKDGIFILQPDDHSCALRSQQIILRNFGIDIPFENLEAIAKEYTRYYDCSDGGTPKYEIGKVMELLGVPVHQAEGNSVNDLARELSQGHNIIVAVDADELWHNGTISEKLYNSLKDHVMPHEANHALIVAGIEVNPNDTTDIKIVLTDPGSGDLHIEYPADQFIDAWKDGNFFMVATDNPAPYQYDAETGMEVPSNFAVEQHINQYVQEHSWQLAPDKINMPHGYQPSFAGHLDTVGNMTYDEFNAQFEQRLIEDRTVIAETENVSANNEDFYAAANVDSSENLYRTDNFIPNSDSLDNINISDSLEEDNSLYNNYDTDNISCLSDNQDHNDVFSTENNETDIYSVSQNGLYESNYSIDSSSDTFTEDDDGTDIEPGTDCSDPDNPLDVEGIEDLF